MDRKEALSFFKELVEWYENDYYKPNPNNKQVEAYKVAIKALENSSHIIDALEKLKDETLDGVVKFGIEKSIECVRKIEEDDNAI